MRRQDKLDVLKAQAFPSQPRLERRQSAARAPSSRGPVSSSVTGSPGSNQALTEPTWGSGSGIATGVDMN
jgi:hypothetical protein